MTEGTWIMIGSNRVYSVTLKASVRDWQENENAPPLKKCYAGYIEPRKLLSEQRLIELLRKGLVISATLEGAVDSE